MTRFYSSAESNDLFGGDMVAEKSTRIGRPFNETRAPREKAPNTVFVGNISYDVDEETLRNYFSECGNILNCRLPKSEGRHRGFGFVEFEDAESMQRAIQKSSEEFAGRPLFIKDASEERAARPQRTRQPIDTKCSVYIRQLSYEADQNSVMEALAPHGKITRVVIPKVPGSDKIKGHAFVHFEDEETADRVAALGSVVIAGRESHLAKSGPSKPRMEENPAW
jgi:nucleolin